MSGLPPVTGPGGRPLDQLTLVGISAYGRHGVFEHERRDGQQFRADVVLHFDAGPAAAGDDLADTVDYSVLCAAVADVIRGEPVRLLETLAGRLAAVCLADPRVVAADVTVHKPQAPVVERLDDVRLTVRRYRDDRYRDDRYGAERYRDDVKPSEDDREEPVA